jgi:cytosine/adenosine deaminase-related metal-dependent hydrolase
LLAARGATVAHCPVTDFSIIDLTHPAMQPVYDPLCSLLHCAAERTVESVHVDGRCIARDGKPRNLDYDGAVKVLRDAQKYATGRIVANDPRDRALSELAPLSLPADFAAGQAVRR